MKCGYINCKLVTWKITLIILWQAIKEEKHIKNPQLRQKAQCSSVMRSVYGHLEKENGSIFSSNKCIIECLFFCGFISNAIICGSWILIQNKSSHFNKTFEISFKMKWKHWKEWKHFSLRNHRIFIARNFNERLLQFCIISVHLMQKFLCGKYQFRYLFDRFFFHVISHGMKRLFFPSFYVALWNIIKWPTTERNQNNFHFVDVISLSC